MSAIVIALIVAIPTLIATSVVPLRLANRTAKARRLDQEATWAREDTVAERAAQTAKAITDRQDEVARVLAAATLHTDEKLAEIHTLVNSDMTAARQAELTQTMLVLTTLKRVTALDAAAGRKPEPEDVEAIQEAEKRIKNLRAVLADRLAQQHVVEAQQAEAARGGA